MCLFNHTVLVYPFLTFVTFHWSEIIHVAEVNMTSGYDSKWETCGGQVMGQFKRELQMASICGFIHIMYLCITSEASVLITSF